MGLNKPLLHNGLFKLYSAQEGMKNHGASWFIGLAYMKTSPLLLVADDPILYVKRVTDVLDSLIQEQGDYLYAGLVFICLIFLTWMFTRRRKTPVRDFPVVILPLGQAPKREDDPEPQIFGNLDDEH